MRRWLTADSAAARASFYDTFVEWCLGTRRSPFLWDCMLGERMRTSKRLEIETTLINYSSYLSVRYASFGALTSNLDAVKFVHTDYMGADPAAWASFDRLSRQLDLLEKLMMRTDPCRRQRDVLSPDPSLNALASYWTDKATSLANQGMLSSALLSGQQWWQRRFTSGLRVQSVCPGQE